MDRKVEREKERDDTRTEMTTPTREEESLQQYFIDLFIFALGREASISFVLYEKFAMFFDSLINIVLSSAREGKEYGKGRRNLGKYRLLLLSDAGKAHGKGNHLHNQTFQ
jgi:hypothetical protein